MRELGTLLEMICEPAMNLGQDIFAFHADLNAPTCSRSARRFRAPYLYLGILPISVRDMRRGLAYGYALINCLRKVFDAKELLPAHYFDFMYGTSTGGLIATMLGRLRMNVPDCLAYYKVVGNSLFAHRRNVLPLGTKYKHKPLESAVKEIVRKHCPVHVEQPCNGEDWLPWHLDDHGEEPRYLEPYTEDSVERICQSICLTATHGTAVNEAYLLRSYNHEYGEKAPYHITLYNIGAEKLRIWEATRATSAAPFFFKALIADVLDETRTTMIRTSFKDGGIRQNNPSVAAYTEFLSLYGDERRPALLLSLGTGVPSKEDDGFGDTWPGPLGHISAVKKMAETFAVFKNMLVKYTQGEQSHQSMVLEAKGQHTWYKRLNVDKGLQNMKLDNWVSSEEVQTTTDGAYSLFFCWQYATCMFTYSPPSKQQNNDAQNHRPRWSNPQENERRNGRLPKSRKRITRVRFAEGNACSSC